MGSLRQAVGEHEPTFQPSKSLRVCTCAVGMVVNMCWQGWAMWEGLRDRKYPEFKTVFNCVQPPLLCLGMYGL